MTAGHRAATVAAATTGVLVGAAMVSTRVVSPDASPATLAFLRYLIGLGVLCIPVLLTSRTRFPLKDAAAIAIIGIFQFAILIVLLNHALETLSAATCALVFSTMPLFTMCLAIALRHESYHPGKLAGLLLAICGVGFLLLSSSPAVGTEQRDPAALAALIGATAIGAVCSILYRPYLRRYATLPTSMLAMCAAVVFLTGLCLVMGEPLAPELSTVQWLNVGFIGLSSGLGYFCWLWALAKIDASQVVAFQALGPVTAAAIELAISRQPPSWQLLVSIALVVSGLLLACLRPAGGPLRP
ncbi:DMT family transporter [Parapusillimonas sp. JC17]|uniref:DMT family transporter n=1 Tax=Parapusillimonas sp. JC17 TaxID=3445768 RepID=UPI003FA07570